MRKKISLFILLLLILSGLGYLFWSQQFFQKDFFSIIVLPDTQKYSCCYTDTFCRQTEWVVDNKSKFNIVFVSHVGDIVQNGVMVDEEWNLASTCLGKLDGVVPYAVLPGNHDGDGGENSKTTYLKYNSFFGRDRFSQYDWYGGGFQENQNSYQKITMPNGEEWLFLSLEVDPTDADLSWANQILQANSHLRAILTTHAYLQDNDAKRSPEPHFRPNGNSGQEIWDKLVSQNCNIFLVLSGHFHSASGEARKVSRNNCGRQVVQVVQNYQGGENGGNGKLKIYSVYPKTNKVEVSTFSVLSGKFDNSGDAHFTFEI